MILSEYDIKRTVHQIQKISLLSFDAIEVIKMSMNIFRLCGDMSHVGAIILILYQLHVKQNGQQFSAKTQELFLIIFITRYLDLFTTFYSLYNTIMKVLYITSSAYIVKMLHVPSGNLRYTINRGADSFKHLKYCVLPAYLFGSITFFFGHHYHSFLAELLWTCSIALESVAILPQAYIIYRARLDVHQSVKLYVWIIWFYRFMYIINWVYRSFHEPYYRHHFFVYFCGVLQAIPVPATWLMHKHYPAPAQIDDDEGTRDGSSEPIIYQLIEND